MNKYFWLDVAERAVKTAAQAAIASIGVSTLMSSVNWGIVFSTAALSAILSVLTSVASVNVGNRGSASVIGKADGNNAGIND